MLDSAVEPDSALSRRTRAVDLWRRCKSFLARWNRVAPERRYLVYLITLIVLTTVLKFFFVFKCTVFATYVTSDMGGYWTRAYERFNGNIFNLNQWVIWPPLFHIILAEIFKVVKFFGWRINHLVVVLGINILLSSASVVYLYLVSLRLTHRRAIALWSAALYALTYHAIYLNAFVLSENFAIPLIIAAIYYLLRDRMGYYLVSGILLGIGTGIRPGFGLLAISFGLFALLANCPNIRTDWKKAIFFNGFKKAAIFSAAFLMILLLILVENNYISRGKLRGLAASSGLNYFFSFTKTYEVRTKFDGYEYVIIPPGTVKNPENGKLLTLNPIYDTAFFKGLANAFIREHPQILLYKLKDIWHLYFGVLFPSYGSAMWFNYLIPVFRVVFFVLTIFVFFSWVTQPTQRNSPGPYLVLLSVILFSWFTAYMYNSEHRYIFGFVFALYPLAIDAIAETFRHFKKYRKKVAVTLLLIAAPFMINTVYAKINISRMQAIIQATVAPLHLADRATPIMVDRLNFPFNKDLTHATLGSLGFRNSFDAEFQGTFTVHADGMIQFFIYCEEGFEFFVDDEEIISRRGRSDEKEMRKVVSLTKGEHTFKIGYHHRHAFAGIKAMYTPLMDEKYGLYYFGEDSAFVSFPQQNEGK